MENYGVSEGVCVFDMHMVTFYPLYYFTINICAGGIFFFKFTVGHIFTKVVGIWIIYLFQKQIEGFFIFPFESNSHPYFLVLVCIAYKFSVMDNL